MGELERALPGGIRLFFRKALDTCVQILKEIVL
jgi:hypothetical protein